MVAVSANVIAPHVRTLAWIISISQTENTPIVLHKILTHISVSVSTRGVIDFRKEEYKYVYIRYKISKRYY